MAALIALVGCGGGDTPAVSETTGNYVSVAGNWSVTETEGTNTCGDTPGTSITYNISVTQTGSAVTVTTPAGTYNGTVSNNTLSWTGSYPESGGTTTITGMTLTVDASGQTFNGSSTWDWTDGSFSCSGTSSISGNKLTTTVSTVTSSTGRVWMDKNLGASQVATAFNDSAAYGDLYQWGRGTDGHEKRTSPTTTTLSTSDTPGHGSFILATSYPYDWRSPQNDSLWQGVTGVNNPCPSGFRLPTSTEWDAEVATWSSNDQAGAFASPLKLGSAGTRNFFGGSLSSAGSLGYYWSSSVIGINARIVDFNSVYADTTNYYFRANGVSVRCLED